MSWVYYGNQRITVMMEDFTLWATMLITGMLMLLVVVPTVRTGVPPMPSSPAVRAAVVDALAQHMQTPLPIFDFGSGWGGMGRLLARRFSECRVTGIEAAVFPWLVSALALRVSGPETLRFVRGDFRKWQSGTPAVIVCYLGPDLSAKVVETVKASACPGSLIVSCFFALPGLTPVDRRDARDIHKTPVYIYRV